MIAVDACDARPLFRQVADGFSQLIAAGVLKPGDKLPSVRSLASQLAINPNTIQHAYRELEDKGYVYSQAGKGSFVQADAKAREACCNDLLAVLDDVASRLFALGCTSEELSARLARLEEGARCDDRS